MQLSPNVLREVNEAVIAALEHEEAGNQAKQGKSKKYDVSFTPENRTATGQYAAKNGNATVVKKFKTTHGIGRALNLSQSKSVRTMFEMRDIGVEMSEIVIISMHIIM